MSKRTRTSKIDKWIKEGRGSGAGSDYKPWLNIKDVSSSGRSTRLKLSAPIAIIFVTQTGQFVELIDRIFQLKK